MLKNYLKIAWRNIVRNRTASSINIGGLAVGMAVALLIGLWIFDELTFDKHQQNYDNIAHVIARTDIGDGKSTLSTLPMPLAAELRNKYGSDFKEVAATMTLEQSITIDDKAFLKTGCYTEPGLVNILTLQIVAGSKNVLSDPTKILINQSLASALFGKTSAVGQVIKVNSAHFLLVAGVYKDIPANSRFANLNFITSIDKLVGADAANNWHSNSFDIYTLSNPNAKASDISKRIAKILNEKAESATKPELFLNPIKNWHLYEFKNGELVSGKSQFIWLFGLIGIFVLLLACINFMNLSTAKSEKRAREVGIRKAIGSMRSQLIKQFFSESFLIVLVAFGISILLAFIALPSFNNVSGKQLSIPFADPLFWGIGLLFCLLTGLLAGSYPALYLSSFKPVKVLKGTFRVGKFANLPRRVLVVIQFTVSVILIIGTIIVFRQIQYAKDRPVGYSRNNLLTIPYNNNEIRNFVDFKNELLKVKGIGGVAASSSPTTGIWSSADNLSWKGKDPNRQEMFGTILVDPDFGNVVNWKIKEGRNFSPIRLTDSSGFLLNEAAVKKMNLANPIGETIKWHNRNWTVLGVVKDMIMTSPYDPIAPAVFLIDNKERSFNVIDIKITGGYTTSAVLKDIETLFKRFAPESPFNYKFADMEYAVKFSDEERIGKLAGFFAALAIFISCLGLFGMASYVAEQRTKEIGIRKILGASVYTLWQLLSADFLVLITISLVIAAPVAYYLMENWLARYNYKTGIPWWVFGITALGAMLITIITISFQSIKAALANPVKSLRTE